MNVVGYIRVSTQGQAKEGYSLKYQEDEIEAYCEEQGLNLIHIFRDKGISGAKLNEEALENVDDFPPEKILEITEGIQRKANPNGDLKNLKELLIVNDGKITRVFGEEK